MAVNFEGDIIGVSAKDGVVMWRANKATWQGGEAGYVAASPLSGEMDRCTSPITKAFCMGSSEMVDAQRDISSAQISATSTVTSA